MKGAAAIKAMLGADAESFRVSLETEGFCKGSFSALADDIKFRDEESSNCRWKMILPNMQSINRL